MFDNFIIFLCLGGNEQLKDMIEYFISEEHSKEKFIQEHWVLIEKEKKEREG